MSRRLDLGGITLPLDAITQTFGILAVRGAGKSNAAAAMAEEMFAAELPFVAVDPVGSWFGLRSAGDGKGPGIPVPIFGGEHGDVPLEKTGGAVVADLVVDERLSAILDVSEFSKGDRIRFLTEFAERLYRRNRDPLHLFLEEADDFIPQRPFREEARCLAAWETIVRRGRSRGLGMTMITQRSAALNKNVLTQVETLLVLRITSPQDRKAIEAWVTYHGQADELLESLSALEAGEAWIWSPHWLKRVERVQLRRRRTFDSGATPKDLKHRRPPATLADVDLPAVQARLAATIEKAKAEDPKHLRAQLSQAQAAVKKLEAELAQARAAAPATVEKVITVPAISEEVSQGFRSDLTMAKNLADELIEVAGVVLQSANIVAVALADATAAQRSRAATAPRPVVWPDQSVHAPGSRPAGIVPATRPAAPPLSARKSGGDASLSKAERKILTALAQYPDGRTKTQVAVLTVYASTGGGFNNALSSLRSAGRITGSDRLQITEAGLEALGSYDPLPTGRELLQYWLGQLSKAERSVLEVLAGAYPDPMTKEAVAAATNYEPSGGGFSNALSRLRTLELISGRRDLVASGDLFE